MEALSGVKKKKFLDSFPAPEYLLLSTTGVSISDKEIKSVQFRRDLFSDCLKLLHSGSVATPPGSVTEGFIRDGAKLSAALQELASKYDLDYVNATLPEEKAYLFTALIDKVPQEGLRDAVAFIIEENVPVKLADSIFAFEVVKEAEEGAKLKVAVSVLPRGVVDSYIEVFENGGLVPVSFDIESQAIARALVAKGDRRSQLIVNISESKTGFYIVEDEVVQFSTTLALGTEGDRYRTLTDLKMELRKIFAFWNARVDKRGFPEGSIEKIILCGSGALQNDFVQELVGDSTVEHSLGDQWTNTGCEKETLSQLNGLDYISAVGLALPRRENYV